MHSSSSSACSRSNAPTARAAWPCGANHIKPPPARRQTGRLAPRADGGRTVRSLCGRVVQAELRKLAAVVALLLAASNCRLLAADALGQRAVGLPPAVQPGEKQVERERADGVGQQHHRIHGRRHHGRAHVVVVPGLAAGEQHLAHLRPRMAPRVSQCLGDPQAPVLIAACVRSMLPACRPRAVGLSDCMKRRLRSRRLVTASRNRHSKAACAGCNRSNSRTRGSRAVLGGSAPR